MMDCNTARLLLNFARPASTELEASEAEALQNHLGDCTECAALAQSQRAADAILKRAMQAVPLPEGLHLRLMKRLDRERDAWWWRRIRRVAAVAAALLLAVGGAWIWWRDSRPELDPTLIQAAAQRASNLNSPKDVEEWYRQRGVTMVAPTQFDYQWFLSPNFGKLPGTNRQVPLLVFWRPGDKAVLAQVFVVSKRQFNLEQFAPNDQISWNYQGLYVIRSAPPNENFAYVVLSSGGPLDRLFKPAAAQ
jgi:hypothetical protein